MTVQQAVGRLGVLLHDEERAAAFVPSTMQVFALDPVLARTMTADDVDLQLAPLLDDRAQPPEPASRGAMVPFAVPADADGTRRRSWIGRLTINVSNACNLWCSYCYADHGYYHAPRSFLSAEDAVRLVDRIAERYGSVRMVQFFGGEPLLNLAAIDAVCRRFAELAEQGVVDAAPDYSATTNGTLSSARVIETLTRWGIDLTVSHDGPREIHDANRPTGPGEATASSFDQIQRSMERFAAAGISADIECTYTARHLRAGTTVVDLMTFFHDWLGQRTFHISPAFLPRPKPTRRHHAQLVFRDEARTSAEQDYVEPSALAPLYADAAAVTARNFVSGEGPLLSFAVEMIKQLIDRRPAVAYCPAFFDQLSIATNGDAYPCFMFIGDPQFRLGNVFTDSFPTQDSRALLRRYFDEFGSSPVGTDEWFAPLNAGCVAGEYIATSTLGERFMSPIIEAIAQECVLGITQAVPSQHQHA